ncbi:hypothetical protein Pint_19227 [Pistacia integerrima]|uniref:Uncharacterized protein n=1 Tax=Pistacia integerrima TaxID=434235 RepID=A0ACC0YWR9_9ROSI|nr:hypothetical protein Pint_19227 [Pistacia integerrima]
MSWCKGPYSKMFRGAALEIVLPVLQLKPYVSQCPIEVKTAEAAEPAK